MYQSKLLTKTQKQAPKDEKSVNAKLLTRAGFIYKEMAGVYSYLPLGLRVLRKIEDIIREEMKDIGGQEILMTVFQPKDLWEETDRWSKGVGKEIMYKLKYGSNEIGLGPTHEEMLIDIVRHFVKSYKDLPIYVFQIQTKFRKELRAKSGLLRGREFLMKDLYSFHTTEEDFKKYYEVVRKAYFKVFKRCGLSSIFTEASGEGFTKEYTHEFQVLSEQGEDTIVFCPNQHYAKNSEISSLKKGDKCPLCKTKLEKEKSIEVGNIFPLGTKYSKDMEAFFVDKNGQNKPIIMGCYGIGISRVMASIVEMHNDKKGIIWPEQVSPFNVHLLALDGKNIQKKSEEIYKDLQNNNIEVLYDDRKNISPGEMFADSDLIGIPIRIVVSKRTLEKNSVEVKKRNEEKIRLIKIEQILRFLNN
ncbi:MAG TPA: hypothetical protein ENH06_01485 [bacterium]|nr:hypothetical protein [bacterium]